MPQPTSAVVGSCGCEHVAPAHEHRIGIGAADVDADAHTVRDRDPSLRCTASLAARRARSMGRVGRRPGLQRVGRRQSAGCCARGLGARAHAEFREDVLEMELDRVVGDLQRPGDGLVGQPLRSSRSTARSRSLSTAPGSRGARPASPRPWNRRTGRARAAAAPPHRKPPGPVPAAGAPGRGRETADDGLRTSRGRLPHRSPAALSNDRRAMQRLRSYRQCFDVHTPWPAERVASTSDRACANAAAGWRRRKSSLARAS